MKVYIIATGRVSLLQKASREAAKFMTSQPGFVGVHPYDPRGTLWVFESLNAAKHARNVGTAKGMKFGTNIMTGTLTNGELMVEGVAE